MHRVFFSSVCLMALVFSTSSAQEIKKADPDTSSKVVAGENSSQGNFEIDFLNGSKVRVIIQSEKLDIATIYGKLSVPVQDVVTIEFGLRIPEEVGGKIDLALKNLNSGDYREREKAAKVLIDLGPAAYPGILKMSRSKETELSRRAKEIVQKLQAKHSKKDLKTTVDDRVVTPTQTIVGRIMTTTVKTKADYFGEVDHKLANMKTLRVLAGPGQELALAVDAVKYAVQGQWLETAFQVDGRSALVITAKGQVDTWPQQPGQYLVGPGGFQAGGRNMGFPGGGGGVGGGGKQRVIGPINGQTYGGMLLGKIGEDGEPFVIGDQYDGTPEAEGKLFLHIGPSPWGASSGAYDVKITRKND